MGKRSDLGASWSHVVQTWFLGQPTTIAEDQGWLALGTLERLAPERIDELNQLPTSFPLLMSRAIRLGLDLALCEPCTGFERVLARARKGERSAISEIMWGALLIRAGYSIELEPAVGTRRADTLIATEHGNVYAELIAPGMSKETTQKLEAMRVLAERVRLVSPRIRLELHLSKDPREVDVDELLPCVENALRRRQSGSVQLAVGAARWQAFRPQASWIGSVSPSTDLARFGVVSFSLGHPDSCLVNVTADISDARIERMVYKKGRQLNRDEANLLVLDAAGVAGSRGEWDPLVRRRFQPDRNTRFGAVVMLHENCEQHELRLVASVVRNPYARREIPASLVEALKRT